MAKVNSERIAAIKSHFEHGEVITEANLADLIDAIAEAAEAHEHRPSGGDGTGTGDAAPVANLRSGPSAQRPANPEVGDVWLETDTSKVFVCFAAGVWTEIISIVNLFPVGAGDNLALSSDGEKSTTSTEYVKAKEFRIYRPGTYRIKFDLRAYAPHMTAYARVYRNGSPVGTEHSESQATWTTFSEDIGGWQSGDYVQLYYRQVGGTGVQSAKVRNFRLYYDQGPLDGYVTLG